MSNYRETGYLFLHNFHLTEGEIRRHFNKKISETETKEAINLQPYKLYINVVQNKNKENLGYCYIWTDKKEIYNLFCGLNLDGSERYIEHPDSDWSEPEEDEEDYDPNNWGDLTVAEDKFVQPMVRVQLPPIVDIYKYDDNLSINIQPMIISERGKNAIYSKNIDSWITEEVLKQHLDIFEKDKSIYKNKFKNYEYTFPIVKFKNNNVTILFSNRYPNTASFLINVIKKMKIKNGDNEKLIFFSQSKN